METENYETNQLLNSIKAGRGYNYEVGTVPLLTSENLGNGCLHEHLACVKNNLLLLLQVMCRYLLFLSRFIVMMDMINWKWISHSFCFMSLVDPMTGSVDGGSGQDPKLRGELR